MAQLINSPGRDYDQWSIKKRIALNLVEFNS